MNPPEDQSPRQQGDRPRRQFQSFPQRSTASANWRTKDDSPRAEPQSRQSKGSDRPQQDDSGAGNRLYVGNLLYSAQKDDISGFFLDNGFNTLNISMSIDPMTGRNPSYCFVDFESVEEANRAMSELNGKDLLGRAVRINPGVARKSGEASTPRTGSYNRGWQRDGGNDSTPPPANNRWQRDEPREPRQSWSQSSAQTKRLYVGNLPNIEPQSSVEEMMQQLFSEFEITTISKLISPHESKKEEPGDHYYLFVDLANADDVDKAIEALDGAQTPWGGNVKVNRAKESKDRKTGREGGGYGGYQRRGDGRPQNGWRKPEDGQ